jgi:type IV pilus assembly protein PilX
MKAKRGMGMSRPSDSPQRGASLIMVMIILTIVSLLGIAAIQISMMSERGARNDRDQQLAWQSAEAALMDAENDLFGPGTSSRRALFTPVTNSTAFIDGCGTTGNSKGLCSLVTTGKPSWLTVDFNDATSSATTTAYGAYTSRSFAAGGAGVQPAKAPRYIIEAIRDPGDTNALMCKGDECKYVYRVTTMGFGPRADIQAVLQMTYRD